MDVGGVIPLHRKGPGNRHVAQRNLDPGAPITDIDETHDITPDFYIPEYNGIKNILQHILTYKYSNVNRKESIICYIFQSDFWLEYQKDRTLLIFRSEGR